MEEDQVYGLIGWTYPPYKQGLIDYAASKGKPWQDFDCQLEYLLTNINEGEGPAAGFYGSPWLAHKDKVAWENSKTPEEAATIFCNKFERPGVPRLEVRTSMAREYYEKFKGQTAKVYTGTPSDAGFIFPIPGWNKRDNIANKNYPSYPGHTGVDIYQGPIVGKKIIAVKDGKVEVSEARKNPNGTYRSYGEYVIIDHGGGIKTLYAHMSPNSRTVQVGQIVKQGQVIGVVGTTGNSDGIHLHFEVRINNQPTDPLPYLP